MIELNFYRIKDLPFFDEVTGKACVQMLPPLDVVLVVGAVPTSPEFLQIFVAPNS
jgi:hypothetical protein